jgi:type IV secretory pathway VirJ component
MKNCLLFVLICAMQLLQTSNAAERTLQVPRFGTLTMYEPAGAATSFALFISGDGGWNQGVVDMARTLTQANALVVGVDIRKYLAALGAASTSCASLAVDFEQLSHAVQKELRLPSYLPPTLVGYSSGATLVYAALAQAPAGTFSGALSLGFCPDLQLPAPLCHADGLAFTRGQHGELVFAPSAKLTQPWLLLQGAKDQVCDARVTRGFAANTPHAHVIELPLVGHGFSVERNWLPQFRAAYAEIASDATPASAPVAGAANVRDLPLTEVPATRGGDMLALLITGDGGWAGLDQAVAAELARAGISVVGLSSLKYFWHARTPEETAHDVAEALRHYGAAWRRSRIVLIGYSQGADVLPFVVNRLPPDLLARVESVNLLGLSKEATFEVSVGGLLHAGSAPSRPIAPDLARIESLPVLCVYGEGEQGSLCPSLAQRNVKSVRIGKGHHFSGEYRMLAQTIAEFSRPRPRSTAE